MTTNIRAWGNSQGIYIPKAALKQIGLEINDSVEICVEGDTIVIKKDTSDEERRIAWEGLKALRKELTAKDIEISKDYKKELEEYFDEKYGL